MEHIKCLRCGRRLKSEQSRQLGYGQICWEKSQLGNKSYNLLDINRNVVNAVISDEITTTRGCRTKTEN